MSYSINHNLMADNVARNLGSHYSRLSTSVQRLSTGLRINSAADDASGLAIRELMRADVSALHQGARNANDAISMVQVADGSLSVIDEKLIRMKELAEQAATGTYSSTQRLMLESEYQAMAAEIDRIARSTDFNGIKLLDGSLKGQHNGSGLVSTGEMKIHFGPGNDSAEDYYYIQIGDCTAGALGVGNTADKPYFDYTKNETMETEHKTFTPAPSYAIYKSESGQIYYSDGKYFFSDLADPANSSLDWTKDREIIDKLRAEQVYHSTTVSYHSYRHPDGQVYYTRDLGRTFTTDPNNPKAPTLTRENKSHLDIIEKLVPMNRDLVVETKWMAYKDAAGKPYYSCDNGKTFFPELKDPQTVEGMLNWNNPDDKEKIIGLSPSLKMAEVDGPKKTYAYEKTYFKKPNPGELIYEVRDQESGKTFFTKNSKNPELDKIEVDAAQLAAEYRELPQQGNLEMTVIRYEDPAGIPYYQNNGPEMAGIPNGGFFREDPAGNLVHVTNKPTIDGLTPLPGSETRYKEYIRYEHRDTGAPYYYDPTQYKYYSGTSGRNEVTDPAILNKLDPVAKTEKGKIVYDVYQNNNNSELKYYTKGDGIFFTNKDDPEGSRLSAQEAANINNIASLINQKTRFDTTYNVYTLKNDPNVFYYSCDGGKTFVTHGPDADDWPHAPGITAADVNPVYEGTGKVPVASYDTFSDKTTGTPVYRDRVTGAYIMWDGSPYAGAPKDLDPIPDTSSRKFGSYYMYTPDPNNNGPVYYSKSPFVQDLLTSTPPPELLDSNFNKVVPQADLHPVPYPGHNQPVDQPYPDYFLIYRDPQTGTNYYKIPGSEEYITNPGNPFTLKYKLTDTQTIGRLEPLDATFKHEWFSKKLHTQAYTISTQEAAQSALEAINMAIESKDKIRAHLGAMQNRLENTITNLNVQAENLQAAESRISDVDVAAEMTEFVRNQILTQSATAMLGQANSMPNMLMTLIGG